MSTGVSWYDLQVFQAVVDGGSLSAAARVLGTSQPTVRIRIDTLERSLGTVLFTRSAAGLVPTEQAEALRVHAQAMAAASNALLRAATGVPGDISGVVRLSVSEIIGAEVVLPMLMRLRRKHAGLALEIAPSNDSADLTGQEADIVLRMYPPTQTNLVAKKVGSISLGFFAHRDYVERRGTPASVSELTEHDLIGPDQSHYDLRFVQAIHPGLDRTSFSVRSDSHVVQLSALRAGAGIGVQQLQVGAAHSDFVRVLPEVVVGELPSWLVMHQDMRRLPKIRATFDHLAEEFIAYCKAAT